MDANTYTSANVLIRSYLAGDERAAIGVFERSVRELAPKKYRPDQVRAWLGGSRDTVRWAERMRDRETFVAMEGDKMLGWIEMERDGHLDMLYCLPEAAGTGVAGALYDALLQRAADLRISRLVAEASRFSEPFFKARGWVVDRHDEVRYDAVAIGRAVMSFTL